MQPLQELRARRMIAQLLAPSAAHRDIGVDADTLRQETNAAVYALDHLYAVQGKTITPVCAPLRYELGAVLTQFLKAFTTTALCVRGPCAGHSTF